MSVISSLRTCFIVLLFLLTFVFIMYLMFPANNTISNIPQNARVSVRKNEHEFANDTLQIPQIIHSTWKTGSAPPSETVRWLDSCKALNPAHEFRMYDDDGLYNFAQSQYPQYFPLFKELKGVYMADMARLLLVYHFGGTYLDLDFYCFRPYICLEKYARHQAKQTMKQLKKTEELTDLLVVSREPIVHAELFRNKSRVVIQDFFMASPKHPFIKWLLDDRMKQFNADPSHPPKAPFSYSIDKDIDRYYIAMGLPAVNPIDIYKLPPLNVAPKTNRRLKSFSDKQKKTSSSESKSSKTTTGTTTATKADSVPTASTAVKVNLVNNTIKSFPKIRNSTIVVPTMNPENCTMPKNITKDKSETGSSTAVKLPVSEASTDKAVGSVGDGKRFSLIIELKEEVLHPLLDATNSRLFTRCTKEGMVGMSDELKHACYVVNQKKFFYPTENTILVHMWTHTYLGWSFLRGTFLNSNSYHNVETTMKPTFNCPILE